MRLSRRWKIGLAIAAYATAVIAMAWLSLPHAMEGARDFRAYQEGLTMQMTQRGADRRAAEGAPPAPEPR